MPGVLLFGDTVRSAALRHEIPLAIIDPVLFAELDGQRFVLTSQLEKDRVTHAIPDAEVLDWFEFGYRDLLQSGMSSAEADREAAVRAVHRSGLMRRSFRATSRLVWPSVFRAPGSPW
jgi:hypothetical protein